MRSLTAPGIPTDSPAARAPLIQSRIMAIADIYDALVASDRPYKKALPHERVLEILREEADKWVLDRDLVDLFISKKIYEKINTEAFKRYMEDHVT